MGKMKTGKRRQASLIETLKQAGLDSFIRISKIQFDGLAVWMHCHIFADESCYDKEEEN